MKGHGALEPIAEDIRRGVGCTLDTSPVNQILTLREKQQHTETHSLLFILYITIIQGFGDVIMVTGYRHGHMMVSNNRSSQQKV